MAGLVAMAGPVTVGADRCCPVLTAVAVKIVTQLSPDTCLWPASIWLAPAAFVRHGPHCVPCILQTPVHRGADERDQHGHGQHRAPDRPQDDPPRRDLGPARPDPGGVDAEAKRPRLPGVAPFHSSPVSRALVGMQPALLVPCIGGAAAARTPRHMQPGMLHPALLPPSLAPSSTLRPAARCLGCRWQRSAQRQRTGASGTLAHLASAGAGGARAYRGCFRVLKCLGCSGCPVNHA